VKRRILLSLLALAVFLPVSLLMGALAPWPTSYGVRGKWDWWSEHKADYDVVFVGSSATAYGFLPPAFDAALRERGHELHSFNLGVGGMTGFEADHMVRQVLENAPPNLRYIFIEVSDWSPQVYGGKNVYSPRMLYWHTPEMTRDALQACLQVPKPAGPKDWRRRSAQYHAELFLRNMTGEGQGEYMARDWLGLDVDDILPTREQLAELHGFTDLDVINTEEWDAHRARFESSLESYTQRVVALTAGNAAPIALEGHYSIPWFEQQIARAVEAGVEPIFYYAPRLAPAPLPYRLHEAGVLPVFFGYNQPERFPELYRLESHFDENHLSRRGAELFSALIAGDFAEHLDASAGE
jgi:hypothetical protein